MRRHFLAALLVTPLLITGALVAPAAAAPPEPVRYVALGDSYSSGSGAGDYDGTACARSANSYPPLWNAANHPASFRYAACGGAVTGDVLAHQISALDQETSLATMTIGGNDADFSGAVIACIGPNGTDESCARALDHSEAHLSRELPNRLDAVYTEVRRHAPNAEVVIADYPRLFETGDQATTIGCLVAEWKRERMNHLADLLDEVIRSEAADAGFRFAEVRPAFAGHGVCARAGAAAEWITRINLLAPWTSYHPNQRGQRDGYLPVVSDAIG